MSHPSGIPDETYAAATGYTADSAQQQAELVAEAAERHGRRKLAAKREAEQARLQQLQEEVLQQASPAPPTQVHGRGRGRARGRGRRARRSEGNQGGRRLHVAGVDDLAVAAAAAGL